MMYETSREATHVRRDCAFQTAVEIPKVFKILDRFGLEKEKTKQIKIA